MQDTTLQYSRPAQMMHWITALLVLVLLSAGFTMVSMDYSPLKLNIYMMHKSFGMLVFALVIARILWRFIRRPPPSLPSHAHWEKVLAHIIHLLLYCGLIGMPLSGWMMSSAAEFPNSFFGLFEFPALTAKDEDLFRLTRTIHEVTALMLVAAIGLHFLGAAKHHLIDKDFTVRRMGGNMLFLIVGGLLLLPASGFVAAELYDEFVQDAPPQVQEEISSSSKITADQNQASSASGWIIDHANSALEVTFQQYGQPVSSKFERFDGTIIFDPTNLNDARVRIEVDTASLKTGSADRDSQSASPDWFASTEYPKAVFTAESFTHLGDNRYEARGTLTIRAVTAPLILPFTLNINEGAGGNKTADMKAAITFKRLDFGVGQGQWAAEDAIANEVNVSIILKATSAL